MYTIPHLKCSQFLSAMNWHTSLTIEDLPIPGSPIIVVIHSESLEIKLLRTWWISYSRPTNWFTLEGMQRV